MESKYKQALFLYNQGDYEGAFDLLYGEISKECLLLKAECKKQITDQYLYLIKETLDCKEYAQARHLKETYLSKYDFDTSINAIQVPDASLESALKAEVSPNDIIYKEISKSRKSFYFPYLILSGLFVLLLGGYFIYDNIYQDRINGRDLVNDRTVEEIISDDPAEKNIYLSDRLIDDDQRQLKSLISEWNDKHTLQESDLFELRSLFADQVFFYGQTLSSEKCIQLIKSIIEKYDTYDQKLVSDVIFTILDDGLVKCDFTKRVAVNGKSKDYEAYLIFRKIGDHWTIETESDKATDAYFERLRKKGE